MEDFLPRPTNKRDGCTRSFRLIEGVEVHLLHEGGGLSKTVCSKVFFQSPSPSAHLAVFILLFFSPVPLRPIPVEERGLAGARFRKGSDRGLPTGKNRNFFSKWRAKKARRSWHLTLTDEMSFFTWLSRHFCGLRMVYHSNFLDYTSPFIFQQLVSVIVSPPITPNKFCDLISVIPRKNYTTLSCPF